MAPAMHTEMWEHPATQANVATLSERGVHIVPPASGRRTGTDTGPGRLPEPEELYAVCARLLEHPRAVAATAPVTEVIPTRGPLRGRHVVVSAGGTREPLDPVRFLGNRSSGKQGYAVAAAAAARGARVTLVTTADLQLPTGVEAVRVETAQQLRAAMLEHFDSADVIVMAAAVADFRPADYVDTKIKKGMAPGDDSAPEIRLVRNPDILAELVRHRGDAAGPVIVGFAAETGDAKASVLEHGRAKLERKGCDVLVVNEVGSDKTFGKDENTVHLLLQGSSRVEDVGPADKRVIADAIWDLVETLV
jgi:phosphopantothenoylcysteine decarboxylase/phosphopantothenate--cysteine ligase